MNELASIWAGRNGTKVEQPSVTGYIIFQLSTTQRQL